MKSKKIQLYPYWMVVPAALFILVFYILPIGMGFVLSFTNWNIKYPTVEFVGLGNYIAMQGSWLCILCVIDVKYLIFRGNHFSSEKCICASSCIGIDTESENCKYTSLSFLSPIGIVLCSGRSDF